MSRTKIEEVTLDALRTRQSLVKGERLVRHEMRAVLIATNGWRSDACLQTDDAGTLRTDMTKCDRWVSKILLP